MDGDLFSFVVHLFLLSIHLNEEGALVHHAWEGAVARTYGEALSGVIPVDGNGGECSVFEVVVVSLVLVELEVGISTWIDVQCDGVGRLCVGVLFDLCGGNDAAGTDKEW